MSQRPSIFSTPADVEQRVRDNVGAAALTGALLVVYGFFMFGPAHGQGLFRAGETVFLLTLKLGGLAMLAIAAWCAFGHLPALRADAVVSAAIGVGLIASAVLLGVGGGFSLTYALYALFGVLMLRAAGRMAAVYMECRRVKPLATDSAINTAAELVETDPPTEHETRRQKLSSGAWTAADNFEPISFDHDKPPTPRRKAVGEAPDDVIHLDRIPPPPDPSDGHLAKMARKKEP